MQKTASINLLRESQTHYTETILQWALTTGRFLIILTETIALAAFVYRFSLDRQIIDLHDEIKDNAAIVELYTQEPNFRNLHERLSYTAALDTKQNQSLTLLQDFVTAAQGKVVYQALTVSDATIVMSITASSTTALSSFIEIVKTLPAIKTVTIDQVENKSGSGTINVALTATLLNAPETEVAAGEEGTDGF